LAAVGRVWDLVPRCPAADLFGIKGLAWLAPPGPARPMSRPRPAPGPAGEVGDLAFDGMLVCAVMLLPAA